MRINVITRSVTAVAIATLLGTARLPAAEAGTLSGHFQHDKERADKGEAEAQSRLGLYHAAGLGGFEKDPAESTKWYRLAAEQNHVKALFALGFAYQNGRGVEKSEAEAVKWYRKAAELNDAAAQNNLGTCYHHGIGVEQNEAEGVKWFRKAAEQNHSSAQFNLANSYAGGHGVKQNYALAFAWFGLAAQSLERAAQEREVLAKKMSAEQLSEARKFTAELQKKIAPQMAKAGK